MTTELIALRQMTDNISASDKEWKNIFHIKHKLKQQRPNDHIFSLVGKYLDAGILFWRDFERFAHLFFAKNLIEIR